jgi:hypothetical protein
MPKWLLRLLLILLLTIEAMHFVSPGTIPDRWVMLIMVGVIMVMVVSIQIGRQKELQQIRDELQELRQELGNREKEPH